MEQTTGRADFRANRARLIEAAQALLRERGMDAEVKEIAERAGVGIGTFYRHFPTKDDLITAIAAEMFGVIEAALDEALNADDPVAAIGSVLRAGAEMSEQYGDLMDVIQGSLSHSSKGHIADKSHLGEADPIERLIALVQKGIDSGGFRADLSAPVAVAMLGGVFLPHMLRRLRATLSIDEIVGRCLDQFMRGAEQDR